MVPLLLIVPGLLAGWRLLSLKEGESNVIASGLLAAVAFWGILGGVGLMAWNLL